MSAKVNERYRAALGMVYPLADTLQMNLIMNAKRYTNSPEELSVHGDQKIRLPVSKGAEFTAECEIKASNVTPDTSWVLMKVAGFMWVMLAYVKKDNELYFWMIDAAKIQDSDRPKTGGMYKGGKTIQFLTDKLLPGAVRIYKRKRDDAEWKLLSEMPKQENPEAIGISGPLSPGEAAAEKALADITDDAPTGLVDCLGCDGIGWIEKEGASSWSKCQECGGQGKVAASGNVAPTQCGFDGCILDTGHDSKHYANGRGFFEGGIDPETGEIDTGEVCGKCDKPRFHAEPVCESEACPYKGPKISEDPSGTL